jgi:hypothetical protein
MTTDESQSMFNINYMVFILPMGDRRQIINALIEKVHDKNFYFANTGASHMSIGQKS